ncbi:SusD/RagB family nutrient-binding outer membrane lipoprotein [Bacteroides sp.]
MKNRIFTYIILTICACGTLSSCSDWLDVNHDPNTAEQVEPGYLFNYAAVNWAGSRTGGDSYIPLSQGIQCQADGGDDYGGWGEAYYEISPYSIGNTWKHYYAVGGNNLQLAIKNAQASTPINHNAIAQCKILLAQHIYEATMLWGDVPFLEAWVEDIKYPKFDSQESVLNGVISLLDEALIEIDSNDPLAITDYDIFYKGDMQKWAKLAKSLKFRMLMVMVDKDPSKVATIGKMLSEGGMISSSAEALKFPYLQTAGNENPKYKILEKYANGVNIMFFAHNNVLKPMQERNDSRIPRYFEPGADGVYRGLNTREVADVTDDEDAELLSSVISAYLLRKDAPEVIYSYQEQLFFEAEAYARGLGVTSDLVKANQLYKAAIKVACDFYEADPDETTRFINGLADLNTLTLDKALYEIHMQQWIDLMDRPLEEFIQWRRSGEEGKEVPTLTVPEEATAKDLIRRWEYSPEELTSNPNAPKESPKIWEKLWFDL